MFGKAKWHKVADALSALPFASNGMAVVPCGGKMISMAMHKETLFAFAHLCPHASGIMALGYIDPLGNVVCPVHRYKFNMQNGRNTSGEGYHLKTYKVDQREDGIYVEL